jgi:hypothetical protein
MSDEVENTPEAEVTAPATEEVKTEAQVPLSVVEELRQKNREYQSQLEEIKKQQEEAAKAELSEIDRLKLELDEQRSAAEKAQQAAIITAKQSKARVALANAQAHNPEKVLRLLDLSNIEEGAIDEAVSGLVESDPYLFRSGEAPAPNSVGSPSSTGQSDGDNNGPDQDLMWLQQTGLI